VQTLLEVLVLEAGPVDHRLDFRIHMPAALTYPLKGKTYNWWYESEPEPNMNNRRGYQPRGKVLVGSSCINGMIHIRGNALDYEKWATNKGLEDWDYAHCLLYFQRFEYRLNGVDEYQGPGGPIYLTTPECDNPLFDALFAAVQQAGYPLTKDVNGYQQEDFSKFERTTYRSLRWNAARAYVHPIKNRSNLTVISIKPLLIASFSKATKRLVSNSVEAGRFMPMRLSAAEAPLTPLNCCNYQESETLRSCQSWVSMLFRICRGWEKTFKII